MLKNVASIKIPKVAICDLDRKKIVKKSFNYNL